MMDKRIHAELVRIAGVLPDPIWLAITDGDGLLVGFYAVRESMVDEDRAAGITANFHIHIEHACTYLDAGKFRYAFLGGDQGVYLFAVNHVLLSFQLTTFASVDHILALIKAHNLFRLLERITAEGELKETGAEGDG